MIVGANRLEFGTFIRAKAQISEGVPGLLSKEESMTGRNRYTSAPKQQLLIKKTKGTTNREQQLRGQGIPHHENLYQSTDDANQARNTRVLRGE